MHFAREREGLITGESITGSVAYLYDPTTGTFSLWIIKAAIC